MRHYIHLDPKWPQFELSEVEVTNLLLPLRFKQGRLLGRMEDLGFKLKTEATFQNLTLDIIKSSEIEGEILDPKQVRSSVAKRLGIEIGGLPPLDRNIDGVVQMMMDATQNFQKPLTRERLFGWHAALFPLGSSGISKIDVGTWRSDVSGPMQVISGPYGRERVHFEAPVASRLEAEMNGFLGWLNQEGMEDPLVRAAIAHFWFVTIHPFDDGNGRIARAISDLLLARMDGTSHRFYSLSSQIQLERSAYYEVLEEVQSGGMNITSWVLWFLKCFDRAMDATEVTLQSILFKAKFWGRNQDAKMNERQRKMLNRVLDGFEGKLTAKKWAKLMDCSPDTALRDINDLIRFGILVQEAKGGRSTSYALKSFSDGGD